MGVPTFYRWLCNRYPRVPKDVIDNYNDRNLDLSDPDAIGLELLKDNPNGEFDNLYLDMNGIIHPCCHPENMEQPQSEEVMFTCILDYLDRIFFMVRPRKLIYLAIDGVAPRAKINQQRSRRFKSAALADLEDETYDTLIRDYEKRYGKTDLIVRKSKWDSNVITPGTEFMYKLSEKLMEYIEDRAERYDAWKRIVVIFSDSNVPGEGEHKIMKFIRNQRHCPDYDPNTRHVLHGMDADLIMLGLATHEPNFFILREIVTFFTNPTTNNTENAIANTLNIVSKPFKNTESAEGVQKYLKMMRENWKPLQFLQLPVLREYLSHQLRFPLGFENGEMVDFERCVDDLVLMIFFCGNDFLPNLPSISITGGSIDQMLLLYQKVLPALNDYLSDEGKLNFHAITSFFELLSKIEDETFKNIHEFKMKAQSRKQNNELNSADATNDSNGHSEGTGSDKSEEERIEDRFKKELKERINSCNVKDDVKLPVDVTLNDPKLWKEAYYREKFNLGDKNQEEIDKFVQKLSFDYIKGICWVLQYYYQGCPSWSWYYRYHYSPFCSDLHFSGLQSLEDYKSESQSEGEANLKRRHDSLEMGVKMIKFDLGVPLTPFQQLMGVMPIRSSHCLPEKLRTLMTDPDSPLREFYPTKFREDPNGKRYKYQWVALLPFIDEKKLLTHVKPIEDELSEEEKIRNRTSNNLIILPKSRRNNFLNNVNTIVGQDTDRPNSCFEQFVSETGKKHRSVLLPGAKIPPRILTVQDLMEEQRNRGFNCEPAKRMILNMLSARRDPYSNDPHGPVLSDTQRDFHQYTNKYTPGQYTPTQHTHYNHGQYTPNDYNQYNQPYKRHHNHPNQYHSYNQHNQYPTHNQHNQYHPNNHNQYHQYDQYDNNYTDNAYDPYNPRYANEQPQYSRPNYQHDRPYHHKRSNQDRNYNRDRNYSDRNRYNSGYRRSSNEQYY
ncbi:XRN 5'-3' exonuclease N-terminus family protein [Theileria parva strain Muguga]|uniref:XRN 5'-3' exonuclease N-terminus family protein n=1 Tax=Theileria parva strain Muguga TaxID=333668 RepID=UPI001C61B663|nr:XRN 5'-3' exonuclease N-terminus family protein [Theileria parva strain Muguga]EAN31721.2 XRN 5'-3' exonuclease N-terminus family protein [Theileria parva strain Muguga]